MTTVAVGIPTTVGDGIHTPPLWIGPTATTAFQNINFSHNVGIPTTNGDGVNTINLFISANSTTLRYFMVGNRNINIFDLSQWRGWTFVIDPATLQPRLPLFTKFPAAQ